MIIPLPCCPTHVRPWRGRKIYVSNLRSKDGRKRVPKLTILDSEGNKWCLGHFWQIRGVRFDGNVCSNKTILLRVLKKVPKMRDGVWKTQEHNGTQGLGSGFPDAKRFCFFFNLGMDMGSFRGIFKLSSGFDSISLLGTSDWL